MKIKDIVSSGAIITMHYKENWHDTWHQITLNRTPIQSTKAHKKLYIVHFLCMTRPKEIHKKWSEYLDLNSFDFKFFDFELAYECFLDIYNHESNMIPYIEKIKSMGIWDYDRFENEEKEYKLEVDSLIKKLKRGEKIDELLD